ncbi:hypothetical protein MHF_0458 [Mycoplasma haemofelis Ohio2]|uniref:Uncharacterized protein n=1 Tax=Mycoplasma haemofelis (strain Ohio2) TaxID=859194 RepID=F6FHJ5_MYCHI|nr:hypothetical protein MHF_0458 [Mycoplasma haemofelis Ohio2]
MGLTKKVGLLSTTSVGGVAGAAALAHHLTSEDKVKTFSDKLRKDHFTLISKEEDWNSILSEYKQNKIAVGKLFKSGGNMTLEELKSSCDRIAKQDLDDSKNYSEFRRLCTVPKTIKSHLDSYGIVALGLEVGDTKDKDSWGKLKDAYVKLGKNIILNLRENLNKQDGKEGWQIFQEACKGLSEIKSTDTEFDFSFDDFEAWCTTQAVDKLKNS